MEDRFNPATAWMERFLTVSPSARGRAPSASKHARSAGRAHSSDANAPKTTGSLPARRRAWTPRSPRATGRSGTSLLPMSA